MVFSLGYRWSDYPDLKPCTMKVKCMTGVQLGSGAYSSVEQVEIKGTKYAAKEVHGEDLHEPDKCNYKEFFSELHILFRLSHSNVVQYNIPGGLLLPPTPSIRHWWWNSCRQAFMTRLFHSHTDLFADH